VSVLANLLAEIEEHGYTFTPGYEVMGESTTGGNNTWPGYWGATELEMEGPTEPEHLWAKWEENKTALLIYALLREPPAWLAKSLECYRQGYAVRARWGGHEVTLRMDLTTLSNHVAAAVGMSPTAGREVRPFVEEALSELDREDAP